MLILSTNIDQNMVETKVFDCHLSPTRVFDCHMSPELPQMAFKSTVSSDLLIHIS